MLTNAQILSKVFIPASLRGFLGIVFKNTKLFILIFGLQT